ncbi:LuxR C-terminal-related transcriptional regulator [Streptacidiphilus sp. ASG 303]|uniref:LuxR C-terminal-related transcriptional regulator n=1 Tax=Streptacidiphilus sp. ASG 303 TaxID=2896847 RepID=UPI001E488CBC|nr:LuxR C-terminal-related transcriptional regulator [Streptacidiphilus sp. ASG 303]MCD0485363.1 LuxR C-terminal-related transcriptional regulator [Streptacidiphilus sp. ASG 303]
MDGSRFVLTAGAEKLYLSVLEAGGTRPSEKMASADQEALQRLVETGLLTYVATDSAYVAVDPDLLRARWGIALHEQARALMDYAAGLPERLDGLSQEFHRSRRPQDRSQATRYVEGKAAIREQIAQLISASTEEIITVQPGNNRAPNTLEVMLEHELPLLRRGVARRTLYQSAARHDPTVRSVAEAVTAWGGEVRTLDEQLQRVFIIDRRTAVMPVAGDTGVAAFTEDRATVAYILACFERDWARADPLGGVTPSPAELASKTQRVIVRLLAEGLGQQAIASRLSLSQRTVAAHIAKVREQYGADTLFQLAWRMGREEGRRQGGEAADTP